MSTFSSDAASVDAAAAAAVVSCFAASVGAAVVDVLDEPPQATILAAIVTVRHRAATLFITFIVLFSFSLIFLIVL
jgi:hypothetical protein